MSETRGLPSVETIEDAIRDEGIGAGNPAAGLFHVDFAARAVLALFEAAVPRIQAEALKSAAIDWWTLNRIDEGGSEVLGDMAGPVADFVNLTTDEWLHERAARIESEAGKQ